MENMPPFTVLPELHTIYRHNSTLLPSVPDCKILPTTRSSAGCCLLPHSSARYLNEILNHYVT
ncbi:hypothetical protein E2C01_022046 [Portunus trituberculatus]|uniref:Uncharacterized protein n=1 Tax=Portunus trituberculatus TaxID=210409 RepID=A0A5B7E684_PORTR|nr:hypothetical protein [Portunus trituberculatus]